MEEKDHPIPKIVFYGYVERGKSAYVASIPQIALAQQGPQQEEAITRVMISLEMRLEDCLPRNPSALKPGLTATLEEYKPDQSIFADLCIGILEGDVPYLGKRVLLASKLPALGLKADIEVHFYDVDPIFDEEQRHIA